MIHNIVREPLTTAVQTISVRIDNEIVTVLLDGIESSAVHLGDPSHLEFEYMQHIDLIARTHIPDSLRALHLGSAACALARAWDHHYADCSQTCVDIDGELMQLARSWFNLPRSPRLRLREGDAWEILKSVKAPRYNVIVRDVFAGGETPAHLFTAEVTKYARDILLPGGCFIANVATYVGRPITELPAWLTTFPHVIAVADPKVWRGSRRGNVVLAGSEQAFDTQTIEVALRRLALPARLYQDL